ncbi:hypothetical protein IFM89_024321 [Coptis chinensis]|uniref:Uncharacterized protein n=1 Tax=Coptis chinensis TaxID=261450 RepID=A0A835IY43_9MAGN|nr:hypothetical protein IFM89_024321 [Coptis chinensis]
MARNANNGENIKPNDSRHALGWDTYANMLHKMNKENPGKIHGQVDNWKAEHEHRNGTILKSTQARFELVEAAQKKIKNATSSGEGGATYLDFDNDELTKVLGVILAQARSSSNSEFKGEMSEMKSSIARVEGVLMAVLKLVTNNGMSNSQLSHGDTTPGTDVGSNSVRLNII